MKRFAALLICLSTFWAGPLSAASFEEGLRAFRAGFPERARDIWIPLAEAGDGAAQYSLGKLYEQGEAPVARDLIEAVRWYREAAAQRLPAAQNNLALMYAKGRGVPLDPLRAIELWTAAADQSYRWAQYNLGLAYFRGQGVAKDERQAAAWFRKAADSDLAQAQFIMGQLKREGLTLQQDSGVALRWYQRAAENGDLRAERQVKALEAAGIEPKQPGPPEIEPRQLVAGDAQPAPASAENTQTPTPLFKTDASQSRPVDAENVAPIKPPEAEIAVQSQPEPLPAVAKKDPEPVKQKPAAPVVKPPAVAQPEAKAVEAAKPKAVAEQQVKAAAETKPAALAKKAEAAPAKAQKPPKAAKVQNAALPAAPAKPKNNGLFRVWLASTDSDAKAASLWEQTRKRHPEVFSDSAADFSRVDLGNGKALIRILVGPLDSQGAAKALCQRLRAAQPGAFCKVQSEK